MEYEDPRPYLNIVGEYGTPIYVLHEPSLRRSYAGVRDAFTSLIPNAVIAYSYKTNPLASVCSYLHAMGATAEVVSGHELEQALALGVPGANIVFNGPVKSDNEIARAVDAGCLINVDHFGELERLDLLCSTRQLPMANIALRANFVERSGSWSKFGFDVEIGELDVAVGRACESNHARLRGLHCHLRSNVFDLSEYASLISRLATTWRRLGSSLGEQFDLLNIGSGFPNVSPRLTTATHRSVPSVADYARTVADAIATDADDVRARVILEPGRCVVAKAGSLLTRVVAVKRRRGRNLCIVDAGTNMVPGVPMYEYDIQRIDPETSQLGSSSDGESFEIHGALCENLDVIGSFSGDALGAGDLLVVDSVGAYDMAARSFDFVRPVPGVVWVGADGSYRLVREPSRGRDIGIV